MRNHLNGLTLAGLSLVCGCAVLTVDVDVYTGPLSNTEEVQAEQVISLVMGAKPLLVQLRDRLEVGSFHQHPIRTLKGGEQHQERGVSVEHDLWTFRTETAGYQARFMSPESYPFHSEHAIRVNEILGLYDDRGPEEVGIYIAQGGAALKRYRKAFEVFGPQSYAEDRRLWLRIMKKLPETNTTELANYEPILNVTGDQRRDFDLLARSMAGDTVAINEVFLSDGSKHITSNPSTTKTCEQLVHGSLLAEHALIIARPRNSDLRIQFETRMRTIAQAFLDSRQALRDLLQATLLGLAVADHVEFESPGKKQMFIDAGAKIATSIIQPEGLWNLFRAPESPASPLSTPGLSQSLALLVHQRGPRPEQPSTNVPPGIEIWEELNETEEARVAEAVSQLLRNDTAAAATELLLLDNIAQSQNHYGLASGPVKGPKSFIPQDIQDFIEQADDAVKGALNGGRLAKGLERLIHEYLAHTEDPGWFDTRSQSVQFQVLLDSLIGFAQKVVTLGNTATLLETGKNSEVRRYITVLQYVGNAVLVHVNELTSQARHADQLNKQAEATAAAFLEAGFTSRILGISGSFTNLNSKQLLEQVLEGIRAQHVKAVLEQSPPQASQPDEPNPQTAAPDKFAQAIAQVTGMKNSKIYLRPASSYLRSSYPATTLNLNDSVGWRNQLDRQQWRSIPVLGQIIDSQGRSRVRQLRELDQQSWQNINRVRVAGVGQVNYTIAKDDIGNWYVKQYAADATNIIKSTRNLAMFAAGDMFGKPLSILGAESGPSAGTNSFLASQLEKALDNYWTQTSNTWHLLSSELKEGSLSNTIAAAWSRSGFPSASVDSLMTQIAVSNAFGIYINALAAGDQAIQSAVTRSDQIDAMDRATLNVLHAVKRYHAAAIPLINAPAAAGTPKARHAFTTSISEFLDRFINQRAEAINRIDASLEIIQTAVE